ncbi:hypothetical protein KM043_008350 [Ampulex compressa]|nr:hypothetical protein KM043_008350 [Ampulex compressa]
MASLWNKERYRQQQEAFVSNHGGTTSQEVVYVILPNVCSILMTTTTLGIMGKYTHRNVRIFMEFALTIVPSILCCTVLSEYVIGVCMSMMLVSVINVALIGVKVSSLSNCDMRPASGRRPFITNFRALTNILTTICILAVDFRVFPRKFAKTEIFGYSLMDTGVGLFVVANALVAPEARDFGPHPKAGFFHTLSKNMQQCTKNSVPLFLLGFGRSVAVECLGYQKHVTEYGVHWNFFITLAVVKLFTSTITSTINSRYSLLSGVWILAMHEYVMSTKGLKEWVLSDGMRDDFVSANREGLISIPGYVGLYLIGVAVGRLIHSTYQNLLSTNNALRYGHKNINLKIFGYEFDANYNESMVLCVKLSLISAQMCAATLFCDKYFRVSRRLANAGYCMWILTLSTVVLTLLLLIEIVTDILVYASVDEKSAEKKVKQKTNSKNKQECATYEKKEEAIRTLEIFEAVNYNGLFFFLLSNIMTGCINMLVFTLYVKQFTAVQILVAYMAINILSVLILYRRQIQIKL